MEVVDQIDAGGGRGADAGNAVVDVLFAVLAGVAWRADALVISSGVDAGGSVLAGASRAGVVFELAADAGVGGRAGAVEAGSEVSAEAAVQAGAADATFGCGFATFAVSSLRAAEKKSKKSN